MGTSEVKSSTVSTAPVVGDAVGVSSRQWRVARVGHNTEKSSRDVLLKKGYEAFAATQMEVHNWKGRRRKVEVVRISTYLFVYINRRERNELITYPFIKSFMIDRTSTTTNEGLHSDVVIPDHEIQRLKYMLYQTDTPVEFMPDTFSKGDYVRVIRGTLQGVVGQLTRVDHTGIKRFGVNITAFGCATVQISPTDLELISESEYQAALKQA